MTFQEWVGLAAQIIEAAGVLTILLGGPVAMALVVAQAGRDYNRWYFLFRRLFGHALLLGLEFLVAADIILTVSHIPTFESVSVLGVIVLIRTFLSFTLSAEIEGRWPCRHRTIELALRLSKNVASASRARRGRTHGAERTQVREHSWGDPQRSHRRAQQFLESRQPTSRPTARISSKALLRFTTPSRIR